MPFHNVTANPKAQASSTDALCGKKRFKDPQRGFACHARAGIGYGKDKAVSAGRLVARVPRTHEQLAALPAHCIDCVSNEIAQHLPNLAIKTEQRRGCSIAPRKRNVGIEETALKDSQRIVDQIFGWSEFRLGRLPVKAKSLIGDRRDAA